MICPHPGCGGEIRNIKSIAGCGKCGQAAFICPKCNEINRAFARYCRSCKAGEAEISSPMTKARRLFQDGLPANFPNESRRIEIPRDIFWVAPVSHRGYLWCLSANGKIWRVSPFSSQVTSFGELGDEFGKTPFIIKEIVIDKSAKYPAPFLLAANPQSIKAFNLLTRETKQILTVNPGEHILSNSVEGFVTLESDGSNLYFLKKGPAGFSLVRYDVFSRQSKDYSIKASGVAGPFKIGDRIGVYSADTFFLLEGDRIKSYLFSDSFIAYLKPSEMADLQPHHGQVPFLVYEDSIYIPGRKRTANASGFLFVSLRNQPPAFDFISVQDETSYTKDTGERLLMASREEISVYERTSKYVLMADEQLIARGPIYYDTSFIVGFAQGSGRVDSLRFYGTEGPHNYPLAKLSDFEEASGFFNIAGVLAFSYINKGLNMRILVWDA